MNNETLKFEGKFELLDVIKAYDFEPREGTEHKYVVGVVMGIAYGESYYCYEIEVIASSHGQYEVDEIVRVPFETTFDYDERIQKWDTSSYESRWTGKGIRDQVRGDVADQAKEAAAEREWAKLTA
jgi:hypothetical protein